MQSKGPICKHRMPQKNFFKVFCYLFFIGSCDALIKDDSVCSSGFPLTKSLRTRLTSSRNLRKSSESLQVLVNLSNEHYFWEQNVDGEIIDRLLRNHDKRIRPNAHSTPTVVTVSIQFVKLSDINPDGHFDAEFFIFMKWFDPRICYNKTYVITLQGNEGSGFWHPDVYFSNALKSSTHTVTEKNSHLNLHPNGSLFGTLRVTVQADCPQDLTRFPFDVQVCKLKIASYSYGIDRMILRWKAKNPVWLDNNETRQFEIKRVSYDEGTEQFPSGIFGFLIVNFKLQRRIGYYIFQVFIPCITVVFLSFVPFWMDPESIGDRLAVGISAVLTIVFLMESINEHLPKVSYFKIIDGYLIVCFLMVFTAIVETIVAFYVSKDLVENPSEPDIIRSTSNGPNARGRSDTANITASSKQTDMPTDENLGPDFEPAEISGAAKSIRTPFVKKIQLKMTIDRICRLLFPFVFIVSNVVYWIINSKNRL